MSRIKLQVHSFLCFSSATVNSLYQLRKCSRFHYQLCPRGELGILEGLLQGLVLVHTIESVISGEKRVSYQDRGSP